MENLVQIELGASVSVNYSFKFSKSNMYVKKNCKIIVLDYEK